MPLLTLPLLDVLLGCALATAAVSDVVGQPGLVHPWTEVLGALWMAPIVLRTRHPLAMCVLAAGFGVGFGALPGTETPLWSFVGVLLVGFSAGANLGGRRRIAGLGALVLGAYVLQVLVASHVPGSLSWGEVYITPPVIVLAPALAGLLLQRSRRQTAELGRLAAELVAEREHHAEAAAAAERTRIARELHDVISHAVSVMVVQAGAAEQLLGSEPVARERVRAIRETGKEALGELRRQLGLMRDGARSSPSPLPGLAQIPDLVATSGADLSLELSEERELPPGLELTTYRVVQEALTNTRRHAPLAPVSVRLVEQHATLEIVVEDSGTGASTVAGAGSGLRGMRERVEMYGGSLVVGPREDANGWRVRARLPLPMSQAVNGTAP